MIATLAANKKIQQKFHKKKKHKTLFQRHLIVNFFSKRKRLGFSFLEKAINDALLPHSVVECFAIHCTRVISHYSATVNQHPPAHHPLDAYYYSVLDEPQLS
jgi:hypothetical protein